MLGAMSRVLAASLVAALALAGFAACEPIQENVPDVSGFNVNRPSAPPSNPNAGDSGTGGAFDPATYCNGGPVAANAVPDCGVSFKTDIYPFLSTGSGACGTVSCHTSSTNVAPYPLDGDPASVWNTLVNYSFRSRANTALQYVNICSTDPAQSGITCNLEPKADLTCGSLMPQTGAMPSGNLALIAEWLTCGAPNN